MGNNKVIRLIIIVFCFLFAGLQAVKLWKQGFSWLELFFLIMFLIIGFLYLINYLRQLKR